MVYRGRIENGRVILAEPVQLPNGTEVRIEVVESGAPLKFSDRYKEFIGSINDLPADMALNHDHYLHGAPKK